MTAPEPSRAAAFLLGVRALLPMYLGVIPFGIIYGVVALQSGIPPLAAVLMSSIVFAGSAQFILAQLVGAGAPGLLIVGAVGLVNLRHALYSASVAPMLGGLPRRWKILLAYLLTDEAYAAAIPHLMSGAARGHWILFGAGFALWAGWQAATLIGVVMGAYLPADLSLDFALPLTFIAIVVPLLTDGRRIAVAVVAAALAVLLEAWPYKLGLFFAALGALAAAGILSRWSRP
jgi:4-azaleucine resistance transporter AzlC